MSLRINIRVGHAPFSEPIPGARLLKRGKLTSDEIGSRDVARVAFDSCHLNTPLSESLSPSISNKQKIGEIFSFGMDVHTQPKVDELDNLLVRDQDVPVQSASHQQDSNTRGQHSNP
eukprot:571031-Rhodomonas_salina.2